MEPSLTVQQLKLKSIQYRKTVLSIIKHGGAGHTGGSLSSIDILNVLYNRILCLSPASFQDPSRDRFVQSKGHSVEALYTVLADRGFFPQAELETLNRFGSHFIGHPTRHVNGVEQNTGALGHGNHTFRTVLVRTLGPDGFAFVEHHPQACAWDEHKLAP